MSSTSSQFYLLNVTLTLWWLWASNNPPLNTIEGLTAWLLNPDNSAIALYEGGEQILETNDAEMRRNLDRLLGNGFAYLGWND